MSCKHETPKKYLIVDKNGIMKYGVGCFRAIVGMGWHPECIKDDCSEFKEKDE